MFSSAKLRDLRRHFNQYFILALNRLPVGKMAYIVIMYKCLNRSTLFCAYIT